MHSAGIYPLEIRIPISPTRAFFHQVRFFDHALRRLGAPYDAAILRVVVGDNADMDAVRAANAWSGGSPIEWIGVPHEIFARFGIHGTADFRLCLEPMSEIVVLADADTVWLREIDPALRLFAEGAKGIAGHMAHLPPPAPSPDYSDPRQDAAFWPWLFSRFGLDAPECAHRYSMDVQGRFGLAPAYFNLGFVVLTMAAAREAGDVIFPIQTRMLEVYASHMRCQISLTLMAAQLGWDVQTLPAAYNAANDEVHFSMNGLNVEAVRVLHYLRTQTIDRGRCVLPEHEAETLSLKCSHPLDAELQRRVLLFLNQIRASPISV